MHRIISAAVGVWLGLAGLALAQTQPVVVELYTSQGCSSCPPADAVFSELAPRDDVIALALHVDYWDYIGWPDMFASPAFTNRQKGYAHASGHKTIYTPQMVIGGRDHLVGVQPMEMAALIADHARRPSSVTLTLSRTSEGRIMLIAVADPPLGREVVVQLVRYRPEQTVTIEHGENAGQTIRYTNIVTDWQRVGNWDGSGAFALEADAPGSEPAVVIVQEPAQGAILAAARLR